MPEYEIFDLGHLTALQRLLDKHGLPAGGHVHVDFVMGVPGGMPGTAEALVAVPAGAARPARGHHVLGHRHRAHARMPVHARLAVGRRAPAGRHGGHGHVRQGPAGRDQRAARRPRGGVRPARPAPADDPDRGPRAAGLGSLRGSATCRRARYGRSHGQDVRGRRAARRGGALRLRRGPPPRLGGRCSTPTGAVVAAPATSTAPIFPRSANKPHAGDRHAARRAARWPTRPTWRWLRRATAARTSTSPGYAALLRTRRAGRVGACAARPTCRSARRPRDGRAARRRRADADPDELLRQARRHAADLRGGRLAAGGVLPARPPAAGADRRRRSRSSPASRRPRSASTAAARRCSRCR